LTDPWHQMADPTSIPGLGGIPSDLPRQGGGRSPRRAPPGSALVRKPGAAAEPAEVQPEPPAPDATNALVQALDRLRATQELRPVETELVRALRGARFYQEESRHDLPIIEDSEPEDHDGLPPDQIG
jgi:hypothetical protein